MSDEIIQVSRDEFQEAVEQLALAKGDFPEPPDKDNLLKVFRDVKDEKKWLPSIKTGFLKKEELGSPLKPLRTLLSVARFAETQYKVDEECAVATFLRENAADIAASSLSLNAKLLEMPFTVKRESRSFGSPRETTKKTWLGETTVKENVEG